MSQETFDRIDFPWADHGDQPKPASVAENWLDDEDGDEYLCYDPERDCPSCKGAGRTALLSGIEWDYIGPDWDTCPRCGGSGRW